MVIRRDGDTGYSRKLVSCYLENVFTVNLPAEDLKSWKISSELFCYCLLGSGS